MIRIDIFICVNMSMLNGGEMKDVIKVMKALSDPNRLKIVKLLEAGEACVCEIQPLLGLSQSTVSKHLKLLEDAGLLKKRKDGQWVLYTLCTGEDSVYAEDMLATLKGWLNSDSEVVGLRKELPNVSRYICRD